MLGVFSIIVLSLYYSMSFTIMLLDMEYHSYYDSFFFNSWHPITQMESQILINETMKLYVHSESTHYLTI